MKDLRKTVLTRFLFLLVGTVFLTSTVTYISVKSLFLAKDIDSSELDLLYIFLLPFFIATVSVAVYSYNKTVKKLSYDINELTKYLRNISQKKYDSAIKIKYFKDFLVFSLLLKNIVKRLNSKDKKKK